MPRRFTLIAVFAALACAPSLGLAQKGTHIVCVHRTGLPRSPKSVIYTTAIRPMNASYFDILKAWQSYVVANIDPNATGNAAAECYSGTEASVGQSVQSLLPIWGKHVETGWEYKGSMTSMPSKPGAVYSWCNSGDFAGDKTVYDTGVFEIGMGNAQSTLSPVETEFAKYLISKKFNKYIFQEWFSRSVACPHGYATRAQADDARVKAEALWKSKGKAVVATGWTFPKTLIDNTNAANSH